MTQFYTILEMLDALKIRLKIKIQLKQEYGKQKFNTDEVSSIFKSEIDAIPTQM